MTLSKKSPLITNLKLDENEKEEEVLLPSPSKAEVLQKREKTYTTDEFLSEIKRLQKPEQENN